MIILVDSREPDDVIANLKRDWPGLITNLLEVGDVSIPLPTGLLVVERKTPSDLLSSIGDGRLFTQAAGLAAKARWPFIAIHGSLLYDKDDMAVANGQLTKWRGLSVRNALLAVQWAGVPVVYAGTKQYDYNRCIAEAIALASKPNHAHFDRKQTRKPPIDFFPDGEQKRQRIEFIASIPGVGPNRARNLLDFCINEEDGTGTVSEALEWATALQMLAPNSRPKDWGAGTFEAVRRFFGLAEGQYLQVATLMPEPSAVEETASAPTAAPSPAASDEQTTQKPAPPRKARQRKEQGHPGVGAKPKAKGGAARRATNTPRVSKDRAKRPRQP